MTTAFEGAVEAAAKASYNSQHPTAPWDERHTDIKDFYRDDARIALEAAAPTIVENAADEMNDPYAGEDLRQIASGMRAEQEADQ